MASAGDVCYYGGIEGGATNTKFVLLGSDGKELVWTDGPGTNIFLEQLDVCYDRLATLVKNALIKANIPESTILDGLGMSLSGAEGDDYNNKFKDGFIKRYPGLAKHIFLTSDSIGTIATALDNGGIVLIAGTGSSCRLLNPNGDVHGCGGWGHILGDSGAAFWISLLACKTVFDAEDGLEKCQYDVTYVKEKMLEFYELKNKLGLLDHVYTKFDKPKFAQFCRILAEGAVTKKDDLCRDLFRQAGFMLGRHVLAVSKNADQELLNRDGGLPIVTVGSVWKSWEVLEGGFKEGLKQRDESDVKIKAIRMYRLTASPAIGAAFLVSKENGQNLPVDFTKNAEIFHEFTMM